MLQNLLDLLTYYHNAAFNPNSVLEPQRCFDQAYGAVQLFIQLYPTLEVEVVELWDTEYCPDFERAIFGSLE